MNNQTLQVAVLTLAKIEEAVEKQFYAGEPISSFSAADLHEFQTRVANTVALCTSHMLRSTLSEVEIALSFLANK